MAKHEVADNKIGSYANKLTAATVDEVVFADTLKAVAVRSDGAAAIYYTVDGSVPTVGGSNTYEIPAVVAVSTEVVPATNPRQATVVKLISAGTPEYSVSKAVV
jgi:Chitobiase/beta-hexosaminidase C-terminal domain